MERTGVCVCICMCSVSCEKRGARLVARRWPRKEDIDWSFLPHHASPFAFLSPFFFALPGLSSFSSTHALLGVFRGRLLWEDDTFDRDGCIYAVGGKGM